MALQFKPIEIETKQNQEYEAEFKRILNLPEEQISHSFDFAIDQHNLYFNRREDAITARLLVLMGTLQSSRKHLISPITHRIREREQPGAYWVINDTYANGEEKK